ncbi:uncharacterized protein LOC117896519 [Drosophila subobscura]|uniref:uncharacterized protein LOC117896519 n=1 Tax=Drosophila subobscura TaxID=7241 RepID=UPI00155AA8F6|nr:uncharacterized protein LOC117896519 [Drosophila subobscura]
MTRRCIVCGEKPIGHFIYPHTMAEAQKWLNLAHLDSYNLEVATFHQRACVCAIHLKGFNEEREQRQKSGTDDQRRRSSVRSSDKRGRDLSSTWPSATHPREMNLNQNMSSTRRQSGSSYTQHCWRSLSRFINNNRQHEARGYTETVSPQYCPSRQQQKQQQHQSMCPAAGTESCMSHCMPCSQGGHYRLSQMPRCQECSSHALTMECNSREDQSQQTDQQPVQQCTVQQQQRHHTAEGIYLTLNNALGQQQQARKCSKGLAPQPKKRSSRSSSTSGQQQTKKPKHLGCQACKTKDQEVQYAWPVSQPSLDRPGCGVPAKIPFSTPSANGIAYPTKGPVSGQRTTPPTKLSNVTGMAGVLGLQNEEQPSPDKNTKPNTVNVLIMAGAPKESCDEAYICPDSFQPSPLSEIRLLQSDLTDGNERADFPDLDHPNYRVCRASTNDSDASGQGGEQDENCADVLVLDKGTCCEKCPNICTCGKTNENGDNCGQWNAVALAQLQQDQVPPEGINWFDTPATSNGTRAVELQKARIKELYSLLAQQNELQQSIQAKMDELQRTEDEQRRPSVSGNETPSKGTQTSRKSQ